MIKDEMRAYTNTDGYLSGDVVPFMSGRTCDNHMMFTAEAYILLSKNKQADSRDVAIFTDLAGAMLDDQGRLHRYPGDNGHEGPDNILGFLAGCNQFSIRHLPEKFLNYCKSHWWLMNPTDGPNTGDDYLFRQPQLIAATYAAAGKLRFWHLPITIYTALVIAVSCVGLSKDEDMDARRLSWLLLQIMQKHSLLCRLTGKLWYSRLRKVFGPEGMKEVAKRYYKPTGNNLYSKYWVTE